VAPPLRQRVVAALLGGAVLWRVVNGVGAVVRWLWLGDRLGKAPKTLLLVTVVVGPIVGVLGGDTAVRRDIWPVTTKGHARRREALVAVVLLPVLANMALATVLPGHSLVLLLQGVVTLSLLVVVLLVERWVGPLLGGDE
jgi:hypothetical protein